jgi:hypothetical protein
MIVLALRSLGERKLRTALTALAVLLGVAMIAGTYVQTDRIRSAFESITQTANRGTDVVVSPREAFSGDLGQNVKPIDEALVARVRTIPGVRRAEGQLTETGSLVIGGEAVSTGFAPSVVSSASEKPFDAFRYESVITAVIGALLGTAIGVRFAALATAALSDLGLEFALPAGQLALFLVLAVVVGVIRAAMPARRASRVDVLDAMRHE